MNELRTLCLLTIIYSTLNKKKSSWLLNPTKLIKQEEEGTLLILSRTKLRKEEEKNERKRG